MKKGFFQCGIAGYTGSGKSLLAKRIAEHSDAQLIDVDSFAKSVMLSDATVLTELASHFGEDIISSGINFSLLGERVFASIDALAALNAIVAKPIVAALYEKMGQVENRNIVVDAALISYWGIEGWFDKLVWVDAPQELRVIRLCTRTPSISKTAIFNRIKLQEELFPPPFKQEKWLFVTNDTTEELFYAAYDRQEDRL